MIRIWSTTAADPYCGHRAATLTTSTPGRTRRDPPAADQRSHLRTRQPDQRTTWLDRRGHPRRTRHRTPHRVDHHPNRHTLQFSRAGTRLQQCPGVSAADPAPPFDVPGSSVASAKAVGA
ncbi:hypothetical protein HBB16_07625 [Pseudonocardia sp. MCCB 268]|nr:hypothetical protein [Pseudonocardia cytotoxica]